MFRVLSCLGGEHDWRLVVLAGLICFLASFVAISLFHRAVATGGRARGAWLALAGAATGCGIWATHFIAMLAYEPGVPVAYDIGLTALSLVLAGAITCLGLSVAVRNQSRWLPMIGGAIVGGGVAVMHYTGMSALKLPGHITWSPELVAASIALGILLGSVALAVAVRRDDRRGILTAAVLLTLAIVSHHFTAMGAVEIIPDPTRVIDQFSISPPVLAIAVASAALAILGMSFAGAFADRRLRERDLQLVTAVNNMPQGLVMFDAGERMVVCNDRYLEMYGLSRELVKPGSTLREVFSNRAAAGNLVRDPDELRSEVLEAVAEGKTTSTVVDAPDGRAIAVTCRPMPGGAWVATHDDITERRRVEQRIAYLAHHDLLTSLPNRVSFNERLDATQADAATTGQSFALLCIDLDRFKEVNDVFGHAVGDGLLRELSRRLQGGNRGRFHRTSRRRRVRRDRRGRAAAGERGRSRRAAARGRERRHRDRRTSSAYRPEHRGCNLSG